MERIGMLIGGVLAGLVLGLLAAWFIFQGDAEVVEHDPDPATTYVDDEDEELPAVPRRVEHVPISPSTSRDLEAWIASLAAAKFDTGTGVIEGQVVDGDGRPLSGVVVRATPRNIRPVQPRWRVGDGLPAERSMREKIEAYVRGEKRRLATRREAVTGDDGRYRIEGLSDGKYTMQAYLRGFTFEKTRRTFEVEAGQTVDFTGKVVVSVVIQVNLPDGTEPKSAKLTHWENENSRRTETWRPDMKEMRWSPGIYEISASAGEHDEFQADKQTVTLDADSVPEPVVFNLEGRPGIAGHVVVSGDDEPDHFYVHVLRFTGQEPDDRTLTREGKNSWAHAHNGFKFSFQDLAAGRYVVGVAVQRRTVVARQVVDVADELVRLEVPVSTTQGDFLTVWAYGSDNKPAKISSMSIGYKNDGSTSTSGVNPKRRKDGSYRVAKFNDHDIEEGGTYFMEVTVSGYGREYVEYDKNETEITIRMKDPATLDVAIRGYSGSGVEDMVRVQANMKGARRNHYYSDEKSGITADGRKVFKALQPGTYEVKLSVKGSDRWSYVELDSQEVVVRPGKNTASLTLPPLYTVTLRVPEESSGKRFRIRPTDRANGYWSGRGKATPDGRVVFERLPAGEYTITGNGMRGSMTVVLPRDVNVVWEVQENNALRVSIHEEDGFLASAGLKTGDYVIGVNGEVFKDELQMRMALGGIMSGVGDLKMTLTVARGASTFDVVIAAKDVRDNHENMGGRMVPAHRK